MRECTTDNGIEVDLKVISHLVFAFPPLLVCVFVFVSLPGDAPSATGSGAEGEHGGKWK